MHEPQGEKCRDAVGGYHEHDSHDLALLPRLNEVGQVQDDLRSEACRVVVGVVDGVIRCVREIVTVLSMQRAGRDSRSENVSMSGDKTGYETG